MKHYVGPRRYLVRFDSWRLPHVFTDVLVIGSGVAGLRAALAAAEHSRVLLISKSKMEESNSTYAQGGVAAVLSPDDSFEAHIRDTMSAGQGLCDEDIAESIIREAPERIIELAKMGAAFDRNGEEFALAREGGHSARRIVQARGDATGREITRALIEKVSAHPDIQLVDHAFTIDILTSDGMCMGALVNDHRWGMMLVWARRTILATGGAGQLYRETTNPDVATGDGMAMAYRAGAELRDLEFVQFHPTTFYVAGAARALISETLRGAGAVLRNRNGDAFMKQYHPDKDLAPRDAVARSIIEEMRRTESTHVFLDFTHLDSVKVLEKFPTLRKLCADFDLDISKDMIPVRPSAHYWMGGVTSDETGGSTLPGLLTCGEISGTGLHGANRLGSNSLMEGLVMGRRAGERAGLEAASLPEPAPVRFKSETAGNGKAGPIDITDVRNSLRSLMGRNVGVERTEEGIKEAEQFINFWSSYVQEKEFASQEGWELQNMLAIAELVAEMALERRETRGGHCRMDHPDADDANWRVHQTIGANGGLNSEPVG